jgi:pimeloyl-ACP methyl ester carboxylesterase
MAAMNRTARDDASGMRAAAGGGLRALLAGAVVVAAALAASPSLAAEPVTHTLANLKRTYDVLLPAGDPTDGAMVVFLHGSGEAKLDRFQADWAPLLLQRKCVVAMPRAAGKLMWRYEDAKYITEAIADAQKRYKTDPKRVILMGVSGGAQTVLFLVDHDPEAYAAVIAVSANPVVIRGHQDEWFYPSLKTAKICPYFVINHITQGTALQLWRQVRTRREEAGTSISILPAVGPVSHYLPPPKELAAWLDDVLAGRLPAPIPDPQKAAVAKMFAPCAGALLKAIESAKPADNGQKTQKIVKDGDLFQLSVTAGADFIRAKKEDKADGDSKLITQVRLEYKTWPIYVRCDARKRAELMTDVLKAEEARTIQRGLLYQVYSTGKLDAGGKSWQYQIGSITYPEKDRGWVSTLFLHASAPLGEDAHQWLEVTVMDETQQPDAQELATICRTLLEGATATPAKAGGGAGK